MLCFITNNFNKDNINNPSKAALILGSLIGAFKGKLKVGSKEEFIKMYGDEKEVNDLLTGLCDMRVIWGGDNTISEIRKSPLKARAGEITFADRYSAALINSNYYLNLDLTLNFHLNYRFHI